MYIDKNKVLASLTKQDIINICGLLGYPDYKEDNNGNLCFNTALCHGGDSPHKLVYYHKPDSNYSNGMCHHGLFHCYTCGDTYSVIELVIRSNRVQNKTLTYYKALYWIAKTTGNLFEIETDDALESEQINDFEWLNRLKNTQKKNKKSIPQLTCISESVLDVFYYAPHQDWLNDHITREALSRYEIGYYGLTNQITIPHRDQNNRLVGIRGRFLDKEDIENVGKYVPLQINGNMLSHSLGSNLYGINVTQDKIKTIKKVMVVEAEKSCMQAYSYFGEDSFVVATCGSSITRTQIRLLLNYLQVEEIIYAPDRDYHDPHSYEAEVWYQKIVKRLAPLVPYCKVTLCADNKERLPYKASPTDRGKDILLELLDEKIIITSDEVNRVLGKQSN